MRKSRDMLTLDQLVKVANSNARDLDNILREILGRRKAEVLKHPRNAEYLILSLKDLSNTVAKLSTTDYGDELEERKRNQEALNRKAEELKLKYKSK